MSIKNDLNMVVQMIEECHSKIIRVNSRIGDIAAGDDPLSQTEAAAISGQLTDMRVLLERAMEICSG